MQRLPDGVRLEAGRGDLPRLTIATTQAEAEIYFLGAHITQFQLRGQKPFLFLSAKSVFEPGKPIRGGVPICFPWFGPPRDARHGSPHGFARRMPWELVAVEPGGDGSVEIVLRLVSDKGTRQEWDGEFDADFRVNVGSALRMELRVRNTGSRPLLFEEALHTYLAVSDVRQVTVEGLANTNYLNAVETMRSVTEGSAPIRITAETDRVYLKTQATCVVHDPGWGRRLIVEKTGSDATVLWNPWIGKAKAMADFGDDEWPFMLCIETCNVRDCAVHIAPGQSHSLTAVIRAER